MDIGIIFNAVWIDTVVQSLIQFRGIWGTLLGAIIGSFTGSYLQRKWDERRRKLREIYKPLFNEVSSVCDHRLPYDEESESYVSMWSEFDYFQRYRTDEKLAEHFNSYTAHLSTLNEFNRLGPDLARYETRYADIFGKSLPKEMIKWKDDGTISLRIADQSWMDLSIWLNRFGHFIYSIETSEEFKTQLIEYSRNIDNKYIYEYWDVEFPGWSQCIWETRSELPPNDFQKIKRRGEAYASLQDEAERLHNLLSDIIEPNFLQPASIKLR